MTTLLSPFAPLHPWLYDALNVMAPVHVVYGPLTDDAPVEVIDLRDLQTRAVVLSALATVGHSLPWALGGIWSPLSNEQAGRVVAEAIRRVGEEPREPSASVPSAIVQAWSGHQEGIRYRQFWTPHDTYKRAATVAPNGWRAAASREGYCDGPEGGEEGRNLADAALIQLGALLWEQVTP